MLTENFSPKSKVKDILLQQPSQPLSTSVLQEIPMKASQIPNRLSYSSSRQDINNYSPSSCVRRNHETKSAVTLSSSGNRNATEQRQNPTKFSEVGGVATVQLHRPDILPLSTQSAKEVFPVHHSDSWSSSCSPSSLSSQSSDRSRGSTLPNMHIPVISDQDQQHEQTPSKEKPLPVNHSSQRRHREPKSRDDNAKKRCLQAPNSDSVPKSAAGLRLNPLPGAPSSVRPSLSPRTTENDLCSEPTSGKSQYFNLSPSLKQVSSQPSQGVKRACVKSTDKNTLRLTSPTKASEDCFTKKDDKRSSLSCKVQHKDNVHSGHHNTGSSPAVPVKNLSRVNQMEGGKKTDLNSPKSSQKRSSGSSVSRKVSHSRRPVIPDDIDQLFTPDPMTYVVNNGQKTVKSRTDDKTKSHNSDKSYSSDAVTSSRSPLTACAENQSPTLTDSPHPAQTKVSSTDQMQISIPTVTLVRVNVTLAPNHSVHNHPVASTEKPVNDELSKNNQKHKSLTLKNVTACTVEKDAASPSPCSPSVLSEDGQTGGRDAKSIKDEESSLDLDLGQNFELDVTQSSDSSEDEQLLSLQEMMTCVIKPPDTPEKGAFSEPSTPGHTSHRRNKPSVSKTNTNIYKNNLDQMMKEIMKHKKAKEVETQLLTCKEDLLRIAENEEAKENRDEAMFAEQRQFLQRYSLVSSAIRDVPPGEMVFNLDNLGHIFNQDSLQLGQCRLNPQEAAQKPLLWSSHAQLRLHINIGLFQEAYNCRSPCPSQVTRFLFKMMSVHNERILCDKILQALCDIAYSAASQIVENRSHQFEVWVPSLADVTLVLMNMGIPFVTLFPFEDLQPLFTERDLLEDVCIKSEGPSGQSEQSLFPEHNCNNILKYLSYCMSLCPRAYSDYELLLLLTLLGTISLETRLIYQSSVEVYPLQYKIVNNIRDWDTMMSRICLAFTDLTDHHHNMCLLVQLLPDNMRGKQLRHHLSLCMISKLLDGNCTYTPKNKEFQLADLRLYLHRMRPSAILRGLMNSSSRTQGEEEEEEEDRASLDQQAYYLCHSLLTLVNEASNFQTFPAHQKEQLLHLCSELATHVKCDIRESKKCLYRSKVKDLVARIDTKWQMLLQRTRPLNGKLYDYWQPGTQRISQGAEESYTSDDEDDTLTEKERINKENELEMEEEDNEAMEEDKEESTTGEGGGTRQPGAEKELEVSTDDTTVAVAEPIIQNLKHKVTEMEVCNTPEVSDEQTPADHMELAE